jgi:hypothetical protein
VTSTSALKRQVPAVNDLCAPFVSVYSYGNATLLCRLVISHRAVEAETNDT